MRTLLFVLPQFVLLLSMATDVVSAEQPNVIVVYSDDQGTIDLNCYGAKDLATPNLDGLAGRGVRFTQMYAPSAICSASRAGFLTGRYPVHAGVPGNVSSKEGVAGMPTTQVTMAETMRSAGYRTGHVGKWHLGYTPETMPNSQGFDESYGHMGGCIDNYSHFFYWNGPNRHDLWRNGKHIWEDGEFFPDLMVRECKKFVDVESDKPFFLYWAINVPHYPMQGTDRWREHYKGLPAPRRMYAEFVSTMDEKIGEVLDHLAARDLTENTIVVFQSDHGHSTEERAFFGGGNPGPYRGAKGCLFEGGIRVPSIVSWPASLPQGEVREQMVSGIDWHPTLCELCGIQKPATPLDGQTIVPIIRSADTKAERVLHWHLGGGKNAQWAVRDGDWKLLGNPQDRSKKGKLTADDKLFLVDLAADPGETKNIRTDHEDVVARLTKAHEEMLESE